MLQLIVADWKALRDIKLRGHCQLQPFPSQRKPLLFVMLCFPSASYFVEFTSLIVRTLIGVLMPFLSLFLCTAWSFCPSLISFKDRVIFWDLQVFSKGSVAIFSSFIYNMMRMRLPHRLRSIWSILWPQIICLNWSSCHENKIIKYKQGKIRYCQFTTYVNNMNSLFI